MIREIAHVGLTVTDLDRSVAFYRDVLGLEYLGEMTMEGPATDALFQRKNARARVAYLNGSKEIIAPPVELIMFTEHVVEKTEMDLFRTSISELCFAVEDIDRLYEHLQSHGVECLSEPQFFDLTPFGFGKSKAIYFKDPDGIILEAVQDVEE
ncbi:MAG: VOC family protein [Tissierellia bacterium]|nr:VOC family protein [Tissierellia bacterium]